MGKFLDKIEWSRALIINFMAMALLAGTLKTFGAFPWATDSDMTELKGKYDAVVALKNQDNQWYRELEIKVATMGNDITHIKDSVAKIENHVMSNRRN